MTTTDKLRAIVEADQPGTCEPVLAKALLAVQQRCCDVADDVSEPTCVREAAREFNRLIHDQLKELGE